MKKIQTQNFSILNILFYIFPITFVIGNQATNLVIILISLISLLLYQEKIFKIRFSLFDKGLFLFFFYLFFVFFINYLEYRLNDETIPKIIFFKTLFFYKYLILYIVLRFLISKELINLQFFNIFCGICVIIISADIYLQFISGKNILTYELVKDTHTTGFFKDELIAGGYIQRFSYFALFLPFFLNNSFNNKNKNNFFIQIFLFLFFLFAIIFSGNRMPLVLYLISFLIYFFIIYKKKYFLRFLIISFIGLLIFYNFNSNFNTNILSFYGNSKNIIYRFFETDTSKRTLSEWNSPYVVPLTCAKIIIKENPIFGGGIKSFRSFSGGCNIHPHNYHLEMIAEIGFVGWLLILFIIYKLLIRMSLILIKELKKNSINQIILTKPSLFPAFFIIFIEFFPLRSSGSFFTTGNATIIFIMLAILVSYFEKIKS